MRRALACVALATLAAAAPQPKPTSTGGNAQRDTPQFEAGDLGLSEDMLQAMIKEILGAGAPNILSDLAAAFDNDGAAPQGLQGAQDSPPGNPSSAGTDTGSGDHGQGSASTGDGIPDIAQLLGGIDWASVFADSGLADIVGDVDLNTLLGGAEDSVGGPATGLPDAAALQELFGQDLSTIMDGTAGTVGDLEAMQKRLQLLAQMDPGVEGPGQETYHGASSQRQQQRPPQPPQHQEAHSADQGGDESFESLLQNPNIPKYGGGKYIPPPPPPPTLEVLEALRNSDGDVSSIDVADSMGVPLPASHGGHGDKVKQSAPLPAAPPPSQLEPAQLTHHDGAGIPQPRRPMEPVAASHDDGLDQDMQDFLEFQEFKRWKRMQQANDRRTVSVGADGNTQAAGVPRHSAQYLAALERKVQQLEEALAAQQ